MKYKIEVINSENILSYAFETNGKSSLLECFRNERIPIDHTCGGFATCGTCKIYILKGQVSARTQLESELYEDRGAQVNERLSCQSYPRSDLLIKIP